MSGYKEKHHIYPVSIFGKNHKTVCLTAKEHFICHYLLFKYCKKKYGLNHWKTHKMGYAFYKMTITSKNQNRYTSRSFEIAKIWYSKNNPSLYRDISGNKNPMYGKTANKHPLFGKPCSKERKRKISIANKGKLTGENNPAKTQEAKHKISESWNNRNYRYTFITPWGEYNRAPKAAKDAPYNVTSTSILNWCKGKIFKEGFGLITHF